MPPASVEPPSGMTPASVLVEGPLQAASTVRTVSITPMRRIARYALLVDVRRMIGVASFLYILLHLILYIADQMFAAPAQREQRLHSGTWATIRYARHVGKPLLIIYPDGTAERG